MIQNLTIYYVILLKSSSFFYLSYNCLIISSNNVKLFNFID